MNGGREGFESKGSQVPRLRTKMDREKMRRNSPPVQADEPDQADEPEPTSGPAGRTLPHAPGVRITGVTLTPSN